MIVEMIHQQAEGLVSSLQSGTHARQLLQDRRFRRYSREGDESAMEIKELRSQFCLRATDESHRCRSAPLLGGPSLEHTRVDLTAVPEAQVGDEVVVIGRQGDVEISLAEVAERQRLPAHVLPTLIGPRVGRVSRPEA
jgi:hypothetical protein